MTTGRTDSTGARSDDAQVFQERLARLAEMSSDGICVHADGRIVFANAAAVRWMNVDPAVGLIGRSVSEFVHEDSYPAVERRLQGLRREGDSSTPSEVVMGRPRRSARDVQATSMRVDWDGRPAIVTTFRDLTNAKAATLLKYQAALLDHVSDAVVGVTEEGVVTSWNAAAETIYGRSVGDVLGLPVSDAVGTSLDARSVLELGGVLHTTHFAADGATRSVRVSAAETDNGFVFVCADMTALRLAERHFESVVMAMDAGVVVFDPDGVMTSANPTAWRIFDGVTEGTAPFAADIPIFDQDGELIVGEHKAIRLTIESGAPHTDHVIGVDRQDGRRLWLSISVRLLNQQDPPRSPILCTFVDVTAQMLAREQLAHAADHDTMTGLPNRAYALGRLARAIAPDADRRVHAVLFVDLDKVKFVNDSHGHVAGDAVLTTVATRMRDTLRDHDVIARLAGDEFLVLLFEPADRRAVDQRIRELHCAAATPVSYRDATITVTASIGVALVEPVDHRDALELLRDADAAMYAAKAIGPGQTRFAPGP
ncbi:diguanylate cyclase [Mycolicibacterium sp. P1-18]|uniref:sensor domain-containing protein n=1 Tax=Mycolicibacterium sp. P1-18 TaxID=2024615 RepID=UPI0011F333DD|nr:diguanylate cyclase [Mycolicibacterium sp. P1-18]KAA0102191.1 diguanylate cyclase [Mycolicibacterium sp. P1-18]